MRVIVFIIGLVFLIFGLMISLGSVFILVDGDNDDAIIDFLMGGFVGVSFIFISIVFILEAVKKEILNLSSKETLEVAIYHRKVLLTLLIKICTFWTLIVPIILGIFQLYYIYRLTSSLKIKFAWVYVVASTFPLLELIIVFFLNYKALKPLREKNYEVGFLGVGNDQIRQVKNELVLV